MKFNIFWFLLSTILTTFVIAATESSINHHEQLSLEDESDIRIPQLGTMQKFQNLGRAYRIPADQSFEDCYENYKNSTPNAKNITSENYPLPYPSPTNKNYSITVENATGIELIIHTLDINPQQDFLKISLHPTDDGNSMLKATRPMILTGKLKEPLKLRALACTNLTIEFHALSDENPNTYTGFLVTYIPFGEVLPPITTPPDVTIPFDNLETISRLLVVPQEKQNKTTWKEMKELFCQATNQYLNFTNSVYLEPCYPDNVTFTLIEHCPKDWPESSSCVEVYSAITLFKEKIHMTTLDPFLEETMPREPGGLNVTSLNKMWGRYGRSIFNAAGYPEYTIPNPREELLLWMGIGIGVILVLFIVSVTVLKSGLFSKRWIPLEEDEEEDTKKQPEIDITMYPSPDQVVPDLFPENSVTYNSYLDGEIETTNEISKQKETGRMIEDGINPVYIDDEEEKFGSNFRMRVNGVNRDEANT